MDPSENQRGNAGYPNRNVHPHNGYNNTMLIPAGYDFLTGALDQAPQNETGGPPQIPHEEGESQTPANPMLGTHFTNNPSRGFPSRSPPVSPSMNAWEFSIHGGADGSLYVGGSHMQNIHISGSGVNGASSSNPHGGSFSNGGHGDYYPSAHERARNQHEAGGHVPQSSFYLDGPSGTSFYLPYDSEPTVLEQSSYAAVFLPPALSTMSQRALEAAGALPLMSLNPKDMTTNQEHTGGHVGGSQGHNCPGNRGNEHSFLPMNEEPQNHQSLFGAQISRYRDMAPATPDQLESHMHQAGAYLQYDVALHMALSLWPESDQLQMKAAAHLPAAAQEAAAAASRTKPQYHEPTTKSGPSGTAGPSGIAPRATTPFMTSSSFLKSVQSLLDEACNMASLIRRKASTPPARPAARGTNPQPFGITPGAGPSSACVGANSAHHGNEDSCSVPMHTNVDSGFRDAGSSSHPVRCVLFPLGGDMLQTLADAALRATVENNRDALEEKKAKLIHLIHEVEATYRRYLDQVSLISDTFNYHAGPHSATRYTIAAPQAMSCHIRTVKDAMTRQLKVVRRALGEPDPTELNMGDEPSLRYVDQRIIRQQRALQQLGMLQQQAAMPWRPQRGLPERAVAIMRAWLFEHFLHPYPKDADKMALAKLTGLTRSQVSNWFINARVRLWKPMVEEMFSEEQRDSQAARIANERLGISTETEQGNDHDAEPSETIPGVQSLQLVLLTVQQDVRTAGDQNHFHHVEVQGPEAKKAKNSASEAFDSSRAMIVHPQVNPEGETSAFACKGEGDMDSGDVTESASRKLKGKAPAAEQ